MKAVVMQGYGDPEVLVWQDFPDPLPGPGEVLVKTAAASINPVDLLQRAGGLQPWFPMQFPNVMGWDVSGTVIALGPGVTDFAVGDRVFAWAFHTYAELCAVKTDILARVPNEVDLVDAGALPLAATTGSQLISGASGIGRGQTILVSGAVGSVGRAAVCTAKDRGAVVIAGVRSDQMSKARALDVDSVVALDDDAALAALPPVDVVANAVRGKTAEILLSKVKEGGTFASVTGVPDNANAYPSVRSIAFVSKQNPETLRYVVEAVRDGRLEIPITQRLPMREAAEAHVAMAKGPDGKILLVA
jgi:NADPH:quinone reductase-like Zn-dependent oxidoreductase